MTILVAGGQRVDAGKTTFATGLVAKRETVGFKPRAGNDFWFDHDDVRTAVSDCRLYGKDAKRLVGASNAELVPEDINPIHRLWEPAPAGGSGLLGKDDRAFLVDRVGEHFVVNGTRELPSLLEDHLALEDAQVVHSLPELNEAMERLHLPALDRIAKKIQDHDRPVVESYSDVARPLRDLEPDAVAVVEPSRVRVFQGERWRKACEVAPGGPADGRLEERVEAVADLVDPEQVIEIGPLTAAQQSAADATAEAYGPLYDAVIDVAGY